MQYDWRRRRPDGQAGTKHRDGYRPKQSGSGGQPDQLTGYCSAQGIVGNTAYDASAGGRKTLGDRKKIRFTYLWDGDSIAETGNTAMYKLYSVRALRLTALS